MSARLEELSASDRPAFNAKMLMSNAKTLAALTLTWVIVAVIATTTAFIAVQGSEVSHWLQIFGSMLLYYSVWVVVSLLIYRIVDRCSGTPAKRALGAVLHLLLFVTVALSLPFLVHFEDWSLWLYGARAPGFHMLAVVVYLLNLVGALLIRFYRLSVIRGREAQEARLKSSLLENQLNLARMDALKMQINPHFLFNALNSIAALIETDRKPEAYHATELLGGLLRRALDQSSDRFLPLEQEVEFVERYIDVEKVRFGSRIRFEVDLDDGCRALEVPALILQPFAENAIKHGVGPSADDVRITLCARLCDETLVIEMADTGPGLAADQHSRDGHGLSNIRKRLALLYGAAAALELKNREAGGVMVTIRLPVGR